MCFNLQYKLTDLFQIVWMFSDIDEMTGGKIRHTLQILWLYKFSLNSTYKIRPWTKSAKLKFVFFSFKNKTDICCNNAFQYLRKKSFKIYSALQWLLCSIIV